MILSLARRVFLFITVLLLASFALIYVHGLHEGIELPYKTLIAGAVLAAVVLAWNVMAIVKTDDYLIPGHERLFLRVTAAIAGITGVSLFMFFLFSGDYPRTHLLYFGAIPAALSLLYILFAIVRLKEAFTLPFQYRPEAGGATWTSISLGLSTLAVASSVVLLALTVTGNPFQPRFEPIAETRPVREDVPIPEDPVAHQRQAEDFYQLAKMQQREDHYRYAYELFQKAARLDHPEADYELALIYSGDGYLRNLESAYKRLQSARAKGHVNATFLLGKAYRHGEIRIKPDFSRAHEYLEEAARAGHLEAQTQLAHMYSRGQGTDVSHEMAFYWMKKAAEQGDSIAQNDIGVYYINGTGIPRNPEEGVRWLKLSADAGTTVAQYNLGNALYEGDLVEQDYELALHYFKLLADRDIALGSHMVGIQYFYGKGVVQDYETAFEAFSQGAAQGNVVSGYYIGYSYLHGLGVERNTAAALHFLENSARRGNTEAQITVARLYEEGSIILRDYPEAVKWYKIAAAKGSANAAERLKELESKLSNEELAEANSRYLAFEGSRN